MMSTAATRKVAAPHIAIRPDWLALQQEPTLESGLAIIDAHHHLWRFTDKVYEVPDLMTDMANGHRVTSTLFVECKTGYRTDGPESMRSVGEMDFVNRQRDDARARGAMADVARASVGYADLAQGEGVGPVLDALLLASGHRMRSIRNISVWHADPGVRASAATPPPRLLLDARFREGFGCLGRRGLGFDAWLVHTQLDELHDLARSFPSTSIVLNHVGGPLALGPYATQRAQVFATWRDGMQRLARLENVAIKIGGFGMPLFGFDFASRPVPPDSSEISRAIAPYVDTCIDTFGADRCMFESNFPVDKGSYNYNTLWNAFKRVTRRRTARELELLFSGTATRLYNLTDTAS